MNASTKTLALLSMTASMGHILVNSNGSDTIKWRGEKLREIGWSASKKYKISTIGKSKLKQLEQKISEVCQGDNIDVLEHLSFLLLGLIDLWSHRQKGVIDLAIKRVIWCIQAFDPKQNNHDAHNRAWEKYEKWNR